MRENVWHVSSWFFLRYPTQDNISSVFSFTWRRTLSFFFTVWIVFQCSQFHIVIIHSYVEGHLGSFHFLSLVNRATTHNMWLSKYLSKSCEQMPRPYGTARSYGRFRFSFFLHTDFQSVSVHNSTNSKKGFLPPPRSLSPPSFSCQLYFY